MDKDKGIMGKRVKSQTGKDMVRDEVETAVVEKLCHGACWLGIATDRAAC